MDIKWTGCAGRNFRRGRPSHIEIEAVVIHIIDGPQSAADATFLNNNLRNPVSAHYSVGRNGAIHQYVQEEDTAFHAGVIVNPTAAKLKQNKDINPNFYTIGIEHDGRPNDEWTDAMYDASGELLRDISSRYLALKNLDGTNVILHREIRANKTCPGFKLDIDRLLAAALSRQNPQPLLIRTTARVNVRIGRPTTSARVDRVLPEDHLVNVLRKVPGEAVRDRSNRMNHEWYETLDGEFIWSGVAEALPMEQL